MLCGAPNKDADETTLNYVSSEKEAPYIAASVTFPFMLFVELTYRDRYISWRSTTPFLPAQPRTLLIPQRFFLIT